MSRRYTLSTSYSTLRAAVVEGVGWRDLLSGVLGLEPQSLRDGHEFDTYGLKPFFGKGRRNDRDNHVINRPTALALVLATHRAVSNHRHHAYALRNLLLLEWMDHLACVGWKLPQVRALEDALDAQQLAALRAVAALGDRDATITLCVTRGWAEWQVLTDTVVAVPVPSAAPDHHRAPAP